VTSDRPRALALVLAGGLLLPALARAESIVLLSPRGDDALASERAHAQQVLADALTGQAVTVLAHADAVASVEDDAASRCDAIECAAVLLQACEAEAAAAVAVWAAGDPPAPGTVFVTLVDRRGDRFPGKARVEGREPSDLARAVKDALLDARALQLLGPGPWLRVRGEPEGAEVVLNGKLVGTVPYRAPVESGRHTLEVRSGDHRAHVQTVDVPPSAARQVELDVELAPRRADGDELVSEAGYEGEAARDRDERSGPVVGPLILGGAGAVLIVTDIALVLGSGCDRRNSLGHCEDGDEIDETLAIAWAGVGAAAVVGAVLWHVIGSGPADRDVAIHAGPDGAAVTLSADF
jgi:hypothetical protein